MTKWMRDGVLAVAVAGAVPAGCSPAVNGAGTAEETDRTTVLVENHQWADVVIYVVRSGRRERLGMVTSNTLERFRLPGWSLAGQGELQLLVDPIGSQKGHLTDAISVIPGDRIEFRVANHLPLSALYVASRR